ncbi:hypothetical protein Gasu2_14360 [Galdieria sulphuraria]|uniref:Uncharacterized protein n=1 Tax=Galdieria sulphuraria TaxID=130081 RepID=M2XYI0_GALSU|nr:uncharacterized protein Gasu_37610 [Galdieria sulphuraria]EME28708.1 hypothetical protein Gasu_37610 [Galdieria sulphuraria]GJD07054.1 hypothetical protein Gasu2_14360 [Galdieria sulphuraria]|eukprot:XP_005705228.1 hypothetical protein Gasu_37610 [Galdieria sulphuraria]
MLSVAYCAVNTPEPNPLEPYDKIQPRPKVVLDKIRDVLNMKTNEYLFVTFDKVGASEGKNNFFDLKDTTGDYLTIYNDFFSVIRELCQ